MIAGKVLVTGGSGFLARAIYEWGQKQGSAAPEFTCYSRDERKQELLGRQYPEVRCILGDVRDRDRLESALAGYDLVIHAAAVKYVPEAEWNVGEAVDVNVTGTRNVLWAARRARVPRVIGISTDKACSPRNVYGMTKGLLERLFAEAARLDTSAEYNVARYGNVVGSTGSTIPKFLRAIARVERIQLTDPDMTRFWMAPSEAVEAINLAASAMARSGSVVAIACDAMRMGDLVQALAGRGHPMIDVIGARPGEKAHETLIDADEWLRAWSVGTTQGGLPAFGIAPPTTEPAAGAVPGTNFRVEAYRSDNPDRPFTAERLRDALDEAKWLGIGE